MSAANRPDDAPDVNHPLLLACRYGDAQTDDHSILEVVERHGLNPEDLRYVAKQRAIRAALSRTGRLDLVSRTESVAIQPTAYEEALMEALTPIYMEAMFIGWYAHKIADKEEDAP